MDVSKANSAVEKKVLKEKRARRKAENDRVLKQFTHNMENFRFVRIECGQKFGIFLDNHGRIWSFGSNEDG